MQKTIFISDLHLEASRPDITSQFTGLLASCDASVDALYILGDLFEVWIGDDDDNDFHRTIISALKQATQNGTKIYIMHGNRDFMLGRKFLKASGCQLLPDEITITLYQTPVLLMHGDTLCTRDIAYIKARKMARNRLLQFLFSLLSLSKRRKIADNMRKKSMQHTQSAPKEIMDVTQDEVARVMQKHQVAHLIHGHTHRPDEHQFQLNGHSAKRYVLAAWHDHGSALIWNEAGEIQIEHLSVIPEF